MVAEIDELFTGTRKNFLTCRNSIEQTVISPKRPCNLTFNISDKSKLRGTVD